MIQQECVVTQHRERGGPGPKKIYKVGDKINYVSSLYPEMGLQKGVITSVIDHIPAEILYRVQVDGVEGLTMIKHEDIKTSGGRRKSRKSRKVRRSRRNRR